jgi:pteridine reductase
MQNILHNETFPSGKLALVTGGAQRIGKAMTAHLALKGWNIAIHFNRSEKAASSLARSLSAQFPNQQFRIFKAELQDTLQVESLLPLITSEMGKPVLLVNNASVFEPANIQSTTAQFLENQFMVNFRAPFLLIRDFARLCGKGMVINMLDTRISGNQSNFAAYTLAKKALWELTRMAAVELGPDIRVNAIAPGLTLPPEGKDDAYLEALARHIPMKRPGGILPVLNALDFILGNEYLTGQLVYCDGGQNLV